MEDENRTSLCALCGVVAAEIEFCEPEEWKTFSMGIERGEDERKMTFPTTHTYIVIQNPFIRPIFYFIHL